MKEEQLTEHMTREAAVGKHKDVDKDVDVDVDFKTNEVNDV